MKHWLQAMRLRTLPLAVASIGMGGFLAGAHNGFRWPIFALSLLTTLSLQILSNLANDYGDTIHGADGPQREGPSRAVQSGTITRSQMKKAIGLTILITLALGLALLVIAQVPPVVFYIFLGLGLLAIIAAILYTNGFRPYGYMGLGDVSVFLFFGWLGVIGTYYLMTGHFHWDLLLPGASCGLLTVAVLNVNNIRDIKSDIQAGKLSIPARLGRSKATWYHLALLIIGTLTAVIYVALHYSKPTQWLFLLAVPLVYINGRAVMTKFSVAELDPYLKQMAITTLAFVLFFGLGITL